MTVREVWVILTYQQPRRIVIQDLHEHGQQESISCGVVKDSTDRQFTAPNVVHFAIKCQEPVIKDQTYTA